MAHKVHIQADLSTPPADGEVLTYEAASTSWKPAAGGGGGYTNEQAQDAVGNFLVDTATIDFTYNDAAPSISAVAITQMSITSDALGLKLSGDSAAPGNTQLYGTDGAGVKGWYAQPSGSGSGSDTHPFLLMGA